MENLTGKVAVITGAASGIGRAFADCFAAQGMKLVLADVEAAPLGCAVDELRAQGHTAIGVQTDVSDAKAMDELGRRTFAEYGAAHVVCNNAGVGSGGPVWGFSTEEWEFVLGPNLWGVIHGVRVFGPHLVAQNEGHIVNTASMAGLVSAANLGPYNVSKQGVVALSETLYGDLRAANSAVGVSVLCPGFVATRIFEVERHRERVLGTVPNPEAIAMRRQMLATYESQFMQPAEIARQVLDAIRTQRFYILTHPGSGDAVRTRMEGILAGVTPSSLSASTFLRDEE